MRSFLGRRLQTAFVSAYLANVMAHSRPFAHFLLQGHKPNTTAACITAWSQVSQIKRSPPMVWNIAQNTPGPTGDQTVGTVVPDQLQPTAWLCKTSTQSLTASNSIFFQFSEMDSLSPNLMHESHAGAPLSRLVVLYSSAVWPVTHERVHQYILCPSYGGCFLRKSQWL